MSAFYLLHRSDFSYSRIATINQHKMYNRNANFNQGRYSTDHTANQSGRRSNVYVNPNYKPANKYTRPAAASNTDIATNSFGVDQPSTSSTSYAGVPSAPTPAPGTVIPTSVGAQKKEIVLGGVAFESSGRSLVRKDRERSFMCPCLLINPIAVFFPSIQYQGSINRYRLEIRLLQYGTTRTVIKKPDTGHLRGLTR